jgi:hypothetical protein
MPHRVGDLLLNSPRFLSFTIEANYSLDQMLVSPYIEALECGIHGSPFSKRISEKEPSVLGWGLLSGWPHGGRKSGEAVSENCAESTRMLPVPPWNAGRSLFIKSF